MSNQLLDFPWEELHYDWEQIPLFPIAGLLNPPKKLSENPPLHPLDEDKGVDVS